MSGGVGCGGGGGLVAKFESDSCNPLDCSLPGFSAHGILQARIRKCIAIPFFKGSFRPRDWTRVSCIATEPQGSPKISNFSLFIF